MSADTVKTKRDDYLLANSFGVESYESQKFPIFLGKWTVFIPNPGKLHWHDLHHVATGYETGWVGEAEISAYELRGGCGSLMILLLCLAAIFGGLFIAPRRVYRAWRRAAGTRNLYHADFDYDSVLKMNVEALRKHLGIPVEGFNTRIR